MKCLWTKSAIVVATIIALKAADAAPPESMGPLTVHPDNPRYFVDTKGRTVWLTGSHTWAYFQERGVEGKTPDLNYRRYLDFLEERGHNFLRLWMWEHARWMQAKIEAGWQYGPEKDGEKKLHPDLLPWDELPEEEKEKDRVVVWAIPRILARAGYTIVRLGRETAEE